MEDCIHEGVEMKDIMSPSDVSVLIVFQEYLILIVQSMFVTLSRNLSKSRNNCFIKREE